ncbi:MAG: DNA-deoxyinosine glycosylase [Actinomycetota bacterium]|nr:DNA-deoxyinosine glycosylase [Actinomycetota bacterium]
MAEFQHLEHAFDPVFDEHSRVLVLGSFPSVLSRENTFYYGNPRNRFWSVIAGITGNPVPPDMPLVESVRRKTALLLESHIALWDVVASCDIRGSSDASICNVTPCDIELVLRQAPIEAIFTNGGTATRLYARYLEPVCGRGTIGLPSTSPANARYPLVLLLERWGEALGPHLVDGATSFG